MAELKIAKSKEPAEQPAKVVGVLRGKWFIWEKQISATKFLYAISKDDKLPPNCHSLMLSSVLSFKDL